MATIATSLRDEKPGRFVRWNDVSRMVCNLERVYEQAEGPVDDIVWWLVFVNRGQEVEEVFLATDFKPGLFDSGEFGLFFSLACQFLLAPESLAVQSSDCYLPPHKR